MKTRTRLFSALLVFCSALLSLFLPEGAYAQAYVGRPKLIVLVVIDQFRGDYLNRDRAQFKGRGFRLFMDQGAWFTDCYYDYANTKTAPGHATIGTGAYSDGHGIETNEFWDAARSWEKKVSALSTGRSAACLDSGQPAGSAADRTQLRDRQLAAQPARYHAGR
jgi:hypothetical protein